MLHKGSPLLILAGVGTGKTETLMRKYTYLIGARKKKPHNIMCVTFTNKAAKEMRKRAALRLNCLEEEIAKSWINTFHSLSNKLLLEMDNYKLLGFKEGYHILDTEDQVKQIKDLIKNDENTKRTLINIVL